MCGISGAIGPNIEINKIKVLGLLNNERGGDSCGIYTGKKNLKLVNDYYDLIQDKEYPKKAGKFVLSHNRKGSSGTNSLVNAQPLVSNKDVLALNGTIKNLYSLEKFTGVKSAPMDNDTAYLLKLLQAGNTEFLEFYTGGATFVYRHNNKITFWVGESSGEVERPLHFCYIGDTMYYSTLARDLALIAEGSPIKHFKTNTLIVMNDNAKEVSKTEIPRCFPALALTKIQKRQLALPFNQSFSTLDSVVTTPNKLLYCGGAYYKDSELFTGVANKVKDGSLSWLHENNTQAKYKFINGVMYDIVEKPSEVFLDTTAINIGLIDSEYQLISELISNEMLYYNADLSAYYFNDGLADGLIQPIGSNTHYHFDKGQFLKMSYYTPEDFLEKIQELHGIIDHLLYEFEEEDLDKEGILIYNTLENYKEHAESNYQEWV